MARHAAETEYEENAIRYQPSRYLSTCTSDQQQQQQQQQHAITTDSCRQNNDKLDALDVDDDDDDDNDDDTQSYLQFPGKHSLLKWTIQETHHKMRIPERDMTYIVLSVY